MGYKPLREKRNPFPTEGYGLLIGWDAIITYMRHKLTTLQRWRAKYDFPVSILPGGNVCTTTSLIDAWLLARAAVYKEERARKKIQTRRLQDHELPLTPPEGLSIERTRFRSSRGQEAPPAAE